MWPFNRLIKELKIMSTATVTTSPQPSRPSQPHLSTARFRLLDDLAAKLCGRHRWRRYRPGRPGGGPDQPDNP